MHHLITAALFILAVGLFNSITLMAAFHILMVPAIIYVIWLKGPKQALGELPKSAWALIGFCAVVVLSVAVNQDIITNGYKNAFKIKYYLIGALSIIPLRWYFLEYLQEEAKEKMIKRLLWTFLIASTLATVSGLIGFYTGYNPLKMKVVDTHRNAGMFGMLITYAHQIAILCGILIALLKEHNSIKKYIGRGPLIMMTSIGVIGLFLTYTRGAILAFLVSLVFLNKKLSMVLTFLAIVAGVTISNVSPKFFEDHIIRGQSNEERIGSWQGAYYAFKEKPILGYGFRNYLPHSSSIKKKYDLKAPYFFGHAHNNYLEVLSTTGLLGFIFFMSWILLWAKDSFKKNILSKVSLIAGSVFIIGGLTQSTFTDGENLFFILAIFSLLYCTDQDKFSKT